MSDDSSRHTVRNGLDPAGEPVAANAFVVAMKVRWRNPFRQDGLAQGVREGWNRRPTLSRPAPGIRQTHPAVAESVGLGASSALQVFGELGSGEYFHPRRNSRSVRRSGRGELLAPALGAERDQLADQNLAPLLDGGGPRFRTAASSRNWSTASASVGSSGLTPPIRPDACHWWAMEEAAVQLLVFRLRRTVSPPIEPWIQIGH
jgi:hypothetical protein